MRLAMRQTNMRGSVSARPQAYSRVQIALHWLIAALIVAQHSTSGAIVRTHAVHRIGQRPSQIDLLLHVLHNRLGLVVIALMIGRLLLRLAFGVPAPADGGRLPNRVADIVHATFYAVLIAEGLAGAIASYIWWPISAVHVILFKILLGLLVFHVGAALWHQFVLRDAILGRLGLRRPFT